MGLLSDIGSWVSEMFAKGIASITNQIDEALMSFKAMDIAELDLDTFVDTFRQEQRVDQFQAMIADPNVSEETKNTEFLEGDEVLPRNYKVSFYVEYVDPVTGETEEGYRTMYVDDRLTNEELENIFIDKWQMGSGKTDQGYTFVSFDTITHSKGSLYQSL
jgi:hypothetical protein